MRSSMQAAGDVFARRQPRLVASELSLSHIRYHMESYRNGHNVCSVKNQKCLAANLETEDMLLLAKIHQCLD